jgi:hypothetical protein
MDMPSAGYADLVRQSVSATLAELGCDSTDGIEEAILIRQGVYCGRRFTCAGGCAVWFVEENQIKFYNAQGGVAKVTAGPTLDAAPEADQPDSREAVRSHTIPVFSGKSTIMPRRRAA